MDFLLISSLNKKLPNALTETIYKEHFLPITKAKKLLKERFLPIIRSKKLVNMLLRTLEEKECQSLDHNSIVPILQRCLENERCIKFLLNNSIFKRLYIKIIVLREKNFVNLNEIDDFALSCCYYLYH